MNEGKYMCPDNKYIYYRNYQKGIQICNKMEVEMHF